MPKFLVRDEIYDIFHRELPEGVYAEGSPSGAFSSASLYAKSILLEEAYTNLDRIYVNMFPTEMDELATAVEYLYFGDNLPATGSLQSRRDRVLGKIRAVGGLSKSKMIAWVQSVIGFDKIVEIANWNGSEGSWILDESELDISTYLGSNDGNPVGPIVDINCAYPSGTPPPGYTSEQWDEAREQAYTYSVLIYSYTMTSDERTRVDAVLSQFEPSRSQHFIFDGLDPADMIGGDT